MHVDFVPLFDFVEERLHKIFCRAGFAKMGLFIFFNEPPIPFDLGSSLKRFAEIQNGSVDQYDFLFFCYRNGVIGYDFHRMSYKAYIIDQDKFDNMSMCARRSVE